MTFESVLGHTLPPRERTAVPAAPRHRALPLSVVVVAAVTVLTGCSGTAASSPATATTAGTRTIVSESGTAEIPVEPERIVALDEPSALNLLSIGITPDVVFDSWRTAAPRAVLEAEGIEIASTTSFYPELEEVAAHEPDLIVGTAAEGFTAGPDYASIAPLVGGLYNEADGQQIITAYGEYFDRADEAARVSDVLDTLAQRAADEQDGDGTSLSVVMSYAQENMPLHMDGANSLHGTIADAGFARPALQDEVPADGSAFGGWTVFSPEKLAEQNADVLAVAVAAQYNREGITDMPLYPSLTAVEDGRSLAVDGDLWSGGAAFSTYWVLRDLVSIASGQDEPGVVGDDGQRWNDFATAIGG
ncbi:MAG: ABC transporter substrate-binding protein [Mycetocola reblochoni]|nr:ABC transporter substrate-binding protein [Mycetocola reblochoni]